MSIEIKGFGDLQKKLDRLQKNAEALSGTQEVPLSKLITSNFMRLHTNVSSFDEFLKAGGYQVNSKEDFEAIPDDEFDAYVRENTKFTSWQDMLQAAVRDYVAKKLEV